MFPTEKLMCDLFWSDNRILLPVCRLRNLLRVGIFDLLCKYINSDDIIRLLKFTIYPVKVTKISSLPEQNTILNSMVDMSNSSFIKVQHVKLRL